MSRPSESMTKHIVRSGNRQPMAYDVQWRGNGRRRRRSRPLQALPHPLYRPADGSHERAGELINYELVGCGFVFGRTGNHAAPELLHLQPAITIRFGIGGLRKLCALCCLGIETVERRRRSKNNPDRSHVRASTFLRGA